MNCRAERKPPQIEGNRQGKGGGGQTKGTGGGHSALLYVESQNYKRKLSLSNQLFFSEIKRASSAVDMTNKKRQLSTSRAWETCNTPVSLALRVHEFSSVRGLLGSDYNIL